MNALHPDLAVHTRHEIHLNNLSHELCPDRVQVMLDLGRRSPQVWVAFDISLAARLTTLRVLRRLTGVKSYPQSFQFVVFSIVHLPQPCIR